MTTGVRLSGNLIYVIDESYKYLGILLSFGNNGKNIHCKAVF